MFAQHDQTDRSDTEAQDRHERLDVEARRVGGMERAAEGIVKVPAKMVVEVHGCLHAEKWQGHKGEGRHTGGGGWWCATRGSGGAALTLPTV